MEVTHGTTSRVCPSITCRRNSKKQVYVVTCNHRFLQCQSFSLWSRRFDVAFSNCGDHTQAATLENGKFYTNSDQKSLLKLLRAKAQNVASVLRGRSIFLIGMMGSGKTTVGKVLSEALGYTFVDSDNYVEKAVGGASVAQIFKLYGEHFFRESESKALRELSPVPRQVVATGGGVVVRSDNWKHMRQGIIVFLDVPVDALARRIAAAGTESRPLLCFSSGDPYTEAFVGLFTLFKKRTEAYSHADATVSLSYLAQDLHMDVAELSPTAIAMEVLTQMENMSPLCSSSC